MPTTSARQAPGDIRLLGAFYTPPEIAQVLADWVLREGFHRVLDPSFGGASFLRAAVDASRRSGVINPAESVYGIDIDPASVRHADAFASKEMSPRENLRLGDFFSFSPEDFDGILFDAVIGNPPYIRHHWWDRKSKTLAMKCMNAQGTPLSGRSSAWAYFVMHSLRFLRTSGRLAKLLPGSALQADYAKQVIGELERRFSRVALVRLRWKVFDSTPEDTVVLVASGFGGGPTTAHIESVDTVEALQRVMRKPHGPAYEYDWRLSLLSASQLALWQRVTSSPVIKTLGSYCEIRIGTVTGANEFFLRTSADKHLGQPGVRLPRAIGEGQWLDSLRWDSRRHVQKEREGRRTRILRIAPTATLGREINNLVRGGEAAGLSRRYKCRIRQPWYALTDYAVPDAFLRCMGTAPGFIVLNEARAIATNAIHRIWWKPTAHPEALAVASASTAFRLGCELFGRTYGGGVLKLDLGVAKRLPIPGVDLAGQSLHLIDRLLGEGRLNDAIDLSDEVILRNGMGFSSREIKCLRSAVQDLSDERRSC